MNPINRRSFIKGSVGAAAILAGVRAAGSTTTARAQRFRILAMDWTLRKQCDPGVFELAARIGVDGVQVDFGGRSKEGAKRPPLLDETLQDRFLAASAQHKMPIASCALGVLNAAPYKKHVEAEQWVIDSIPAMQRLRVPLTLLAFFGDGDLQNDPAGVAEVVRRLQKLGPRAEDAGVVFGFESWLKVPELERILDAVKSPAIKIYYDVGNMQKVGEDVYAAIRRLGRERICELHLKDYTGLYGQGVIDFTEVRRALDAIGYRGWLGIERPQPPPAAEVEASIRSDLEYLRRLFPQNA